MYHSRKPVNLLLIIILSMPGLSQLAQAEVSLPPMQKETDITPAALLGTNENNLGLQAGRKVPDFTVNNFAGSPISLTELLETGPLLVIFYRGGWCPYCNFQIRQLSQHYAEFETRGVRPVLISVDQPSAAVLVKNAYAIPFPVLSDPELNAHEAFNVVLSLPPETYKRYQDYGIDLEAWSGKAHHKIALAAAFLVDKTGTVKWAHVTTDYKTRPSPEQLLKVIDNNQ